MSAPASPPVPVPTPAQPAHGKGEALMDLVHDLLPLRRCITGDGLRATLRRLGKVVPLDITEIPSGTRVLDWTVPPEWRVREAYLETASGERFADWAESPLHVVQYSVPVQAVMTLAELRPHLHTLPEQPDAVPYRTSYYDRTWGFCLRHETLRRIADEGGEEQSIRVVINTDFTDGAMTLGETVIRGASSDEVLVSAHACHPALANDNASSLAVAAELAAELSQRDDLRFSYRFVFAPGTIGAVAWLAHHRAAVGRIRHGLVLANLGDRGGFTYKQTRRGTLTASAPLIDRAVAVALGAPDGPGIDVRPFTPEGYDERQYGSPGFDLPVGRLTRTPHGEYPEYHTSKDDLSLLSAEALAGSLDALRRVVEVIEGEATYLNTEPFGEPMMGRRGLYASVEGEPQTSELQRALLWVLNLSDGRHSLLDVAERSGLPFTTIRLAADRLFAADLLARRPDRNSN